jgi:hypothetical protein
MGQDQNITEKSAAVGKERGQCELQLLVWRLEWSRYLVRFILKEGDNR